MTPFCADSRRGSVAFGLLSLSLVCLFAGCGTSAVPCSVAGTVTYAGEPVERGAIRFVAEAPTEGPGGLGPVTDGKFSISAPEMIAGRYLVVISGFKYTGKTIQIDDDNSIQEDVQFLPRRYNADSREYVELKPGENVLKFDLQP